MMRLGLHRIHALIALPWHRWHFKRLHPLAPADLVMERLLKIHALEAHE